MLISLLICGCDFVSTLTIVNKNNYSGKVTFCFRDSILGNYCNEKQFNSIIAGNKVVLNVNPSDSLFVICLLNRPAIPMKVIFDYDTLKTISNTEELSKNLIKRDNYRYYFYSK